jgi:hypothetical protein
LNGAHVERDPFSLSSSSTDENAHTSIYQTPHWGFKAMQNFFSISSGLTIDMKTQGLVTPQLG